MSNFTDVFGAGGMKPKRITQLTSGAGTFTPLLVGGLVDIIIQAAGGGGQNMGYYGGGAGAAYQITTRIFAAMPYVVGAAGGPSGSASDSYLGSFTAMGGRTSAASLPGFGGQVPFTQTQSRDTTNTSAWTVSAIVIPLAGAFSGGAGGSIGQGNPLGVPIPGSSNPFNYTGRSGTGSGAGGGSGGDSLLGTGARTPQTSNGPITPGIGYGWGGASLGASWGGSQTTPNLNTQSGGPALIYIAEYGV